MTPTFVSPQILSDEYLITALIPRPGLKPIVVNAVAGMSGWAIGYRDTRGRMRQTLRRTRGGALAEVQRIATLRFTASTS